MVSISAPFWVLSFAFERKFLEPRRLRSWSTKTEPFVHTGKRGLLFELHPREFIDREIYVEGIFEKRLLDFLRAYFTRHPGRVALDVGCNIGNHCCYLADTFQEIHAFDPNPVATARFRKNIDLNGICNVRLNMVGLSDARSTLHLKVNSNGNLGNSMLLPEFEDGSVPVPVITGDEYVRENVGGGSIS